MARLSPAWKHSALLALLVAVACACLAWWPRMRNEFFVLLGNRDEAGGWYGWWSGNAGGLQVFEWLALGALLYWHRTCHVHNCLRLGRHLVEGTGIVTCRRHHPVLGAHRRLTAEKVLHLHREAQR